MQTADKKKWDAAAVQGKVDYEKQKVDYEAKVPYRCPSQTLNPEPEILTLEPEFFFFFFITLEHRVE